MLIANYHTYSSWLVATGGQKDFCYYTLPNESVGIPFRAILLDKKALYLVAIIFWNASNQYLTPSTFLADFPAVILVDDYLAVL